MPVLPALQAALLESGCCRMQSRGWQDPTGHHPAARTHWDTVQSRLSPLCNVSIFITAIRLGSEMRQEGEKHSSPELRGRSLHFYHYTDSTFISAHPFFSPLLPNPLLFWSVPSPSPSRAFPQLSWSCHSQSPPLPGKTQSAQRRHLATKVRVLFTTPGCCLACPQHRQPHDTAGHKLLVLLLGEEVKYPTHTLGMVGLEAAEAAMACHGAWCPQTRVSCFLYVLLLETLTTLTAARVLCIRCQLRSFPSAAEEERCVDPGRAAELTALPAFEFLLLFSVPSPKAESTECCLSTLCPKTCVRWKGRNGVAFRESRQALLLPASSTTSSSCCGLQGMKTSTLAWGTC